MVNLAKLSLNLTPKSIPQTVEKDKQPDGGFKAEIQDEHKKNFFFIFNSFLFCKFSFRQS